MKLDTNLIFDAILAVLGLYLTVAAIRMKRSGEPSRLLLPEQAKQPKEKGEYVDYMFPRMLVFAVICVLAGILGLLDDFKLLPIPYWELIEMGIVLAAFLLFYRQMGEARNRFC